MNFDKNKYLTINYQKFGKPNSYSVNTLPNLERLYNLICP